MTADTLLKIVRTWKLSSKPEYRGFRCAACQKHLARAYHHFLGSAGFLCPIHFCRKCETKFRHSKLTVEESQSRVDRKNFEGLGETVRRAINQAVEAFPIKELPTYKRFSCDRCGREMKKAFHVWFHRKNLLTETHFCRRCGEQIGLSESA